MGQTEKALSFGNEAQQIAEALGDCAWQAAAVHCLALIHMGCTQFDAAASLFEEELRLWEQAGERGLSAFVFMLLGEIAFHRGELTKAHQVEEKAAAVLTDMGGLGWVAVTKALRGHFSLAEGRLQDAARHYSESMRLSLEQTASMNHFRHLLGLASVASACSLHDTAALLLGAADDNLEVTGQRLYFALQPHYDRVIVTSRSAIGATTFDAVQQRGRDSDHALWLHCADIITQVAAAQAGARGDVDRSPAPGLPGPLRRHVGAD